MGRKENVEVFNDTENQVKTVKRLKESVESSLLNQKLYLESDTFPNVEKNKYSEKAKVIVSKKRTLEAAMTYKSENVNVCVHNFASATNPGGGVTKGSSAQEECLCRCSTLYFNLNSKDMWDGFYSPHRKMQNPIHNDDCIYTPNVVVLKTDTNVPELMPEKDWYEVNVVTCAAPNLRLKPANSMNQGDGDKQAVVTDKELYDLHIKRFRRILDVALLHNNEVIILGAFGCGAFQNNPEVVAKAAKDVIKEYMYAFKTIEFAVYCSPQSSENYNIFNSIINK